MRGWDAIAARPAAATIGLAAVLAAIAYWALLVRADRERIWPVSAGLLPPISLKSMRST